MKRRSEPEPEQPKAPITVDYSWCHICDQGVSGDRAPSFALVHRLIHGRKRLAELPISERVH